MRKIISKIAGLMLGLSLAAGVGVAVGSRKVGEVKAAPSTETFSHSDIVGMATAAAASTSGTYSVFTITVDGIASSGFNASESVRVYKGASITVSVSSGNITSATLTCTANGTTKYGPGSLTGAGWSAGTGKTGTWTGSAASFTLVASANQARISDFSITYEAGGDDPSHTHNWVAGTVHAPTCTEQGYTEYTCSECEETKHDDFVSALGHDYGAWTQVTAPTCLTAGEERRVCSHDSTHVETRPIAALGHSYVDGICERCGAEEPNEATASYVFSEHYSADTVIENETISLDDNINILFVKREGGTDTKYYSSGTAARWYGGGTFTVSSSAGNIQSVEITFLAKHDNAITADVGSYSDSSSASGTGTWVGNSDTVVFSQAGTSGHARISALSVTYDLGSDPVVTYTITYLANAEGVSGTMSPTTGAAPQVASCNFTRDGYEFARWNTQADGEGEDYTVGSTVSEDVTLYVIWQEYVAPIEGNVSMEGVTSYSSVTVNGHPALKCGAGSTAGAMKLVLNNAGISKIKVYVAGWKGDTSKTINIETTGCTMTEDSITVTEDTAITGSGSSFTLNGAETTYRFTFDISDATAGAEITLTAAQASKNRFVVWGATDLFAESFANEFNSNLVCDASGNSEPSYEGEKSWTSFQSFYNGLDAEEQGRLHDADANEGGSEIEQAMARYDYVVGKYGDTKYPNFINRAVNPVAGARLITGNINSSSSTIIIVVVALTSITSIGVLLVIKRKRSLVK